MEKEHFMKTYPSWWTNRKDGFKFMLEATTVTMLYIGTLCDSHACLDYELIFAELNNTQELAIDKILKSSSLLDFI